MVFVLDAQKNPLMPCTEKRARLLLERGRARLTSSWPAADEGECAGILFKICD